MLYISFNYRELHRLKEAVFAPHMVNAGPCVGRASELPRDARTLRNRAHHIMTRDPITIGPDDTVSEAVSLLLARRISCLPVVDSEQVVRGIVTWRDCLQHLLNLPRSLALQAPDPSQKRRFYRTPISSLEDLGLEITVLVDERVWTVRPLDISVGGILIEFPPGDLPDLASDSQLQVTLQLEAKTVRLTGVINRQHKRRCSLFFREVYPQTGGTAEPPQPLREIVEALEEQWFEQRSDQLLKSSGMSDIGGFHITTFETGDPEGIECP